MSDYYCRFCDEFIRQDETERKYESLLHSEVDTRREEVLEYIVCPSCGYELVERADDCLCGELKLETEHLCRSCKKIAEDEWQNCIDEVTKQINGDRFDAKDILETYVEHYVF